MSKPLTEAAMSEAGLLDFSAIDAATIRAMLNEPEENAAFEAIEFEDQKE